MIKEELKPMDVGIILDKSFRLAFSNLKKYFKVFLIYLGLFVGISIVIGGAVLAYWLFNGKTFDNLSDPNVLPTFLLFIIPLSLVVLVFLIGVGTIYTGMLYDIFIKSFLGEEWNFKDSFKFIGTKIWRIIGAFFFMFFIIIGGYLMCCIGVIPMMTFISLVIPALLFENLTASQSISRSFKLVSYSFWKVLGAILLLFLIIGGLGIIFQIGFQFLPYFMNTVKTGIYDTTTITIWIVVISIFYILYLAYTIITSAISNAFYVILFFNQKIKHENFGIEHLAESMIAMHKEEKNEKTVKKEKKK